MIQVLLGNVDDNRCHTLVVILILTDANYVHLQGRAGLSVAGGQRRRLQPGLPPPNYVSNEREQICAICI